MDYARVKNDVILSYPLNVEEVNALNDPTSNYFEIYYDPEPEYDSVYEYLEETPRLIRDYVIVSYKVKRKNIETILDEIFDVAGHLDGNGNRVITYNLIPSWLFKAAEDLATERTEEMMNAFAKTRGYSSMASLCSYAVSGDVNFLPEGQRGVMLRDTAYAALYAYTADIKAQLIDPPTTWNDILVNLPAFTWD